MRKKRLLKIDLSNYYNFIKEGLFGTIYIIDCYLKISCCLEN